MPLVLGIRYPLAGLRALRRPKVALLDSSTRTMRVRLMDCDVNFHINNGRYLSLMDLGRIEHAARCGLIAMFHETKWTAVAGGVTIRFRRELRFGTKYTLTTRCVGWDEGWSYWEQEFAHMNGKLAARAYAKVATLDKTGARLPSATVMQRLGHDPVSPPLPEGVLQWQRCEHG